MPSSWKSLIYTVILAIVLGTMSGILGTVWTSSYLSDYAFELSELTAPLRVDQKKPRNVPSSYNEAVEGLVESSLPSVVEVYRTMAGPLGYSSDDLFDRGVVLTTDGWVAIASVDPTRVSSFKTSRVRANGEMYSVVESAYDSVTQTLFLKLDANNLSVVSFGKGRETRVGEQVFVVESSSAFLPATITEHTWPKAVAVSSDKPQRRFLLDKEISEGFIVFNLSGDIIGFGQDRVVLPFESILPAFHSLLETKKISRASLGVSYIDLSHQIDIAREESRGLKNGALVYGNTKNKGFQIGDILQTLNGESINYENGLDEILEEYKAGDKVSVTFDRAGEVKTVEVILGEVGK
ncbi:serine protease [Candidatus Uhrbacteria bacterium]|nr:serine protease [Candidatus Uhrbacteria bacterium]